MEIRKYYDIENLVELLRKAIEKSKKGDNLVKLNLLTAHNILDVLEETCRREQKHQTLESALTFMEKEDGTHTNELEEQNQKPDCYEDYAVKESWVRECEECPKETEYRKEAKKPDCYGNFLKETSKVENEKCFYCQYFQSCFVVSERVCQDE